MTFGMSGSILFDRAAAECSLAPSITEKNVALRTHVIEQVDDISTGTHVFSLELAKPAKIYRLI